MKKRLLGHLPLSEVSKVRILEYKSRHLQESIMRHGEAVDRRVKGSSVNREVSRLITALNLGADERLCDGAPRIKKEREIPRERTLTAKECQSLLDVSRRWLQRCLIAANETGLDRGVLIRLTWDSVKDGLIKVHGGREKTGAKQVIGISAALQEVLDELREEYRRVPNMEKRVFTRKGKPISKTALRHAFDRAVAKAKIEDFQFLDFRHCARTRWAASGIAVRGVGDGSRSQAKGIAGRYTNLTDDQIRDAYQKMYMAFIHGESSTGTAQG